MDQRGEREQDLKTYLMLEMVERLELLTAAELTPRCRTGVAWVG